MQVTPARATASAQARARSMARSTGFSQKICLPAAAAVRIRSACVSVYEQISTAPIALSSNTSAVAAVRAPCCAASSPAASALGSTTYLSRAPASRARLPAWILPMRPAPKSATSIMVPPSLDAAHGCAIRSIVLCYRNKNTALPIPARRGGALDALHEEPHALRRRPHATTSSASAASPSTSTRSRSAPASRTSRASPSTSAARRPTPRSAARGSGLKAGDGRARRRRRDGPLPRPRRSRAKAATSRHVSVDPTRLTACVVLGIKDRDTFPLIFYRENCADMAVTEDDVAEDFLAQSQGAAHHRHALLDVARRTASAPRRWSARAATTCARSSTSTTGPVLWGLTKRGDGETRFIASDTVTAHLQAHPAAVRPRDRHDRGVRHRRRQHRHHRGAAPRCARVTPATLVVKRGPLGCAVIDGADSRARSTRRSTARA